MNVIFFGDSITTGEHVPVHETWVHLTSEWLWLYHGHTAINAGVNGDTTRLALERMPSSVQRYGCGVLVVQFGLNDCNQWESDLGLPRVSPNAYYANLCEIIQRGRQFGAAHIFMLTSHPVTKTEQLARDGMKYNEIMRCATGPDIHLVDIERKWHGGLLLPDGIHLNKLGHRLYYDLIAPALGGVL